MTPEKAIEFCEFEADRIKKSQNKEWMYELRANEGSNRFLQLAELLRELKSLRSMRDSIVKIINENNAPAAWKYDMIVDEVMEHENFGCGED